MSKVDLNGYGMNVDVIPATLPLDTIFLHGNLASNTWWEPSLALWKKQAKPGAEGRFIAAEWRGCGKSDAPRSESELNMAAMADDYIALCQKMGIKKACLVGHSTGGLIALYMMIKAPQLFERTVLLDPVGATGAPMGPEVYAAFTQMSENREICEAVMSSTIHGNDPKNPQTAPLFQRIVDDAFHIAKINWHGVPNALQKIDIRNEVAAIQQPVLVLQGEHDPIIPMDSSQALAAGLPKGKLDVLKGQGHSCNVENPELFVAKVNEFLFQ